MHSEDEFAQVFAFLCNGTGDLPPVMRYGGGNRGPYLEFFEPKSLFLVYSSHVALILGIYQSTILNELDSVGEPRFILLYTEIHGSIDPSNEVSVQPSNDGSVDRTTHNRRDVI